MPTPTSAPLDPHAALLSRYHAARRNPATTREEYAEIAYRAACRGADRLAVKARRCAARDCAFVVVSSKYTAPITCGRRATTMVNGVHACGIHAARKCAGEVVA